MKSENFVNNKNYEQVFNLCYGFAKGDIRDRAAVIRRLRELTGMSEATALFHVNAMVAMLEGVAYKKRINFDVVEYFIKKLSEVGTEEQVQNAVKTLIATADYMDEETEFKDSGTLRELAEKYS